MTETTAIAIPEGKDPAAFFREENGISGLLDLIEKEALSHAPDTSTKKGRDAITSLAYKVSRTKTLLDKAGKVLNDETRKQLEAVDAQRRNVRDTLDSLRDKIKKPLLDWEAAEEARKKKIEEGFAKIDPALTHTGMTSEEIEAALDAVRSVEIDDSWGEYEGEANLQKQHTIDKMKGDLDQVKQHEAEQKELAQLRAEKEERERVERERIEREEAEKAEREAEERRQREAEERAKAEAEAAQKAKEQAEAEAKEREERMAREAEEREARLKKEAEEREEQLKKEAEEARAAERQRIEDEARAEEEARLKREADAEHLANIKSDIMEALRKQPAKADVIAQAMIDGDIPHVKVMI